jgi:hypothetical protein
MAHGSPGPRPRGAQVGAARTRAPNLTLDRARVLGACLVLVIAACGEDPKQPSTPPVGSPPAGTPPPAVVVGPPGGTVAGPDGARVVIPPGALPSDTTIKIERSSSGAPPLTGDLTPIGQMFAFTPHGTTFAVPATISVPFDPASLPAGTTPALYKTNAQNQWEEVTDATFGAVSVRAQVTSFSVFLPARFTPAERIPGPTRQWEFSTLPRAAAPIVQAAPEGHGIQVGDGLMYHHVDLGNPVFDIDDDGVAAMEAFSSASGITFWVSADAPLAGNVPGPQTPVATIATLHQWQSFIKHADNATLELIVTEARMEAIDHDGVVLSPFECAQAHLPDADDLCQWVMQARVEFSCKTIHDGRTTTSVGGNADLNGWDGHWRFATSIQEGVDLRVFEDDFFIFEGAAGSQPRATLKGPIHIFLDLKGIPLEEEFTLECTIDAIGQNNRGRESGIGAYLRDPQQIGGSAIVTTGLEATNRPDLTPPPPKPPLPACTTGPNPASGVLQLSAASYSAQELPFSADDIVVTRTQGSAGAVSVNVTTGGGTADEGTDYTRINTTVHFGDGDTEPRVVALPILLDAVDEGDETVELTLSEPGGCATLGPQSSAVLKIFDDDGAATVPSTFTVGGNVHGLIGTLVLENHRGLFLEILDDGPFTFSDIPTPGGQPYRVKVFNQPHDPVQRCTVTNGEGTFTDHDITDIVVTCV